MTLVKFLGVIILAALLLGVHSAKVDICRSPTINILCNADTYKWVQIVSVVEEPCGTTPVCTDSQRNDIKAQVITACVNTSSCTIRVPTLCAAQIDYSCIQGEATTPRTVITTPPRALLLGVHSAKVDICRSTTINILCNADTYKWVQIVSVVEEPCGTTPVCTDSQRNDIKAQVIAACVNTSSCTIRVPTLCAAQIDYNCIQGEATTPRTVITTPPREDDWVKDFGSWQWAIIWIIIGVILVAAAIFIVLFFIRHLIC